MGPLNPEVVHGASYDNGRPASSVLILGEQDGWLGNSVDKVRNYWLAEYQKTTGQGFTVKVDSCARTIAGVQMKNIGKGIECCWWTKEFKVSSSKNENGPWETLLEDELVDTRGQKAAALLNFTFDEPVEVQYLRFDLVSYWGDVGGGLQYFAPIPATSKLQHQTSEHDQNSFYLKPKGGSGVETTTDGSVTTTTVEVTSKSLRVISNLIQIAFTWMDRNEMDLKSLKLWMTAQCSYAIGTTLVAVTSIDVISDEGK